MSTAIFHVEFGRFLCIGQAGRYVGGPREDMKKKSYNLIPRECENGNKNYMYHFPCGLESCTHPDVRELQASFPSQAASHSNWNIPLL